jgi:hypothetical protein
MGITFKELVEKIIVAEAVVVNDRVFSTDACEEQPPMLCFIWQDGDQLDAIYTWEEDVRGIELQDEHTLVLSTETAYGSESISIKILQAINLAN